MKHGKRIAAIVVALLLLAGIAWHFLFGYVDTVRIGEHVTVLTRQNLLGQIGANVIVYADRNESFVVDTQLAPLAASTRAGIEALNIADISAVFITHWHPDHSGGIPAWSGGVAVIAHPNVMRTLSAPQLGYGLTKPGSVHEFEARAGDGVPSHSVSSERARALPSRAVNIKHYPHAHTDGDIVVTFPAAKVAAVGDLVWPGSFPFVDVHNGGSVAGLRQALQDILGATDSGYSFVPGHGTPLKYADIRQYLSMVEATSRWVAAEADQGKTADDIAAAGLPDEWTRWSSTLVPARSWIDMVLASRAL